MCGISAFLHLTNTNAPNRELMQQMNDAQFHRGPDEGAIFIEGPAALAHRRLSIIDVATGQQPLTSVDGRYTIIFNGEIYNYRQLRDEIIAQGITFQTKSDTEVILQAWSIWKEKCVDKLNGMFAFVIWNKKEQSFFIARDRFGIKPFFYTIHEGVFYCGSELKTLTCISNINKTLNPQSIEQYFALGYVPEPNTIFKNVYKLKPGHTLKVATGSTKLSVKQYWDISFNGTHQGTEQELAAELTKRFKSAVASHMESEVPLGSFLSGGVDSSAVVAMMSQISNKDVTTCSIGFAVKDYNETEFAQQVAKKYHTDHKERIVESDDYDLLDKLSSLYDEPYADSSAIPTYRVCQLARENVTVALSGDGADELLAGYRRYKMLYNEDKIRAKFPKLIRKPVFGLLGKIYPKLDWAPRFLRAKSTFQSIAKDCVEGYFQGVSLVKDEQRSKIFSPSFNTNLKGYNAVQVFKEHQQNFDGKAKDTLSLLQYIDLKTYLVGDILTKVDRASMAHSLEVRVPFLDHEFAQWAVKVPTKYKLNNGVGKFILKKAMEPHLPNDVLYRDKMGFRVPLAEWFRGPLKQKLKDRLLSDAMRNSNIFDINYIEKLINEHQSGIREHSAVLWTLLMFEAFYRRQIS